MDFDDEKSDEVNQMLIGPAGGKNCRSSRIIFGFMRVFSMIISKKSSRARKYKQFLGKKVDGGSGIGGSGGIGEIGGGGCRLKRLKRGNRLNRRNRRDWFIVYRVSLSV